MQRDTGLSFGTPGSATESWDTIENPKLPSIPANFALTGKVAPAVEHVSYHWARSCRSFPGRPQRWSSRAMACSVRERRRIGPPSLVHRTLGNVTLIIAQMCGDVLRYEATLGPRQRVVREGLIQSGSCGPRRRRSPNNSGRSPPRAGACCSGRRHVNVGVTVGTEPFQAPQGPGRRLLLAVIGVGVDGQRDVAVNTWRAQRVPRLQCPGLIEGAIIAAAGRVLLESARISTVCVPAATTHRCARTALRHNRDGEDGRASSWQDVRNSELLAGTRIALALTGGEKRKAADGK